MKILRTLRCGHRKGVTRRPQLVPPQRMMFLQPGGEEIAECLRKTNRELGMRPASASLRPPDRESAGALIDFPAIRRP